MRKPALFKSLTGQALIQSPVNVPLIPPGTRFLGRENQVHVRVTRQFKLRHVTLEAQADAYNALSTGVVLNAAQTLGSALDGPASILQGRLVRFGLQAKR